VAFRDGGHFPKKGFMAKRIIHHTLANGSGLNRISTSMAITERMLGMDSYVSFTNPQDVPQNPLQITGLQVLSQADAIEADVHVIHSHLQDNAKGKTIFVPHGTPEHCFAVAVSQSKTSGYVAGDPLMLSLYRINRCDATVTFWDRHAFIWKSMSPKSRIETVPMGVDTNFWKPTPSIGKWAGSPSLFTCENCHQIKWPLDVVLAFPLIMEVMTTAVLHMHYIPLDTHRFWYPLMAANGVMYKSFSSGNYFAPPDLRNAFNSVDYYLSLVRYGDFNSVCLEANSCGCKIISYKGNPYAHYWISEGSQIDMALELINIFKGETKPREVLNAPSLQNMSEAMIKIYESL